MSNRRKFIGQSLAGLSGLALSSYAFPNIIVPRQKDKLGVALVGLGYYSRDLLAPALQLTKNCYLAGIVTGTPSKIPVWQEQYNIADKNVYSYDNYDDLANNPDIDIVYVVLPPSMHAEYSIRASNAGKHTWCEKPMAMTEAECQAMIDAANKNKVKLSIGYRMQHEPNTQRIIRFGKEEKYGKVQKVTVAAGYREGRTDHWKQKKAMGGGVTYDMGVYPLNAARYAVGKEPIAVTAKASTTRPEIYHEVEETMVFDLEFPGDATAACEASFGKGMNTLQVDCAKGWYKLEPFQAYNGIDGMTSDGVRLNAPIQNEQATQMDNDTMAIVQKKPVLVPGEEGLKDIRVVEAIHRSAASGKRVEIG